MFSMASFVRGRQPDCKMNVVKYFAAINSPAWQLPK